LEVEFSLGRVQDVRPSALVSVWSERDPEDPFPIVYFSYDDTCDKEQSPEHATTLVVHLRKSEARAIASALMGAAADL